MKRAILYVIIGYLSGSVLFASLAEALFHRPGMIEKSSDGNPGAANAFLQGGGFCGLFVVCGDILKGLLPVLGYCAGGGLESPPSLTAAVLAAPVVGHILPLYFHFRGGKGIAVTFGCLLGLLPLWEPLILFAFVFLFFSLVLRVPSHFHRTIITYLATTLCLFFLPCPPGILMGFCAMTGIILLRFYFSKEVRPKMEVKPLWKR